MWSEDELVQRLRPSTELVHEVVCTTAELVDLIRGRTAEVEDVVDVRVVGSVAKGTYVGRPDIDIFILFRYESPRPVLEKVGLAVGKAVLPVFEERYAEHPYVHGLFKGFEVDIVPCYSIESTDQMRSAVDRTPFHTKYILDNLTEQQRDQVRLLKQFMKGVGTYGAEAKVQGFSGYLIELMVIKFGDFQGCVRNAASWKYGTKVSMEGALHKGAQAPLSFIDPVDRTRNVASALTVDQFCKFVFACQEFLSSPDRRFFFPVPRETWSTMAIHEYFKNTGFRAVAVRCPRPDGIDDNVYPQARKTLEGFRTVLEQGGFNVLDRAILIGNDVKMAFLLEADGLSKYHKHIGPPVWLETSRDFLDRWEGKTLSSPFMEGGRWVVMVARDSDNAAELLRDRVQSAALGSGFRGFDFEVVAHGDLIGQDLNDVLTELLDKRMPWTR